MKKLFITALVLSFGFAGFSQNNENETPDSTLNTKANYNTTRSNKKSLKVVKEKKEAEKEKKVNTTLQKPSGGKAIKPKFQTILERREMN